MASPPITVDIPPETGNPIVKPSAIIMARAGSPIDARIPVITRPITSAPIKPANTERPTYFL